MSEQNPFNWQPKTPEEFVEKVLEICTLFDPKPGQKRLAEMYRNIVAAAHAEGRREGFKAGQMAAYHVAMREGQECDDQKADCPPSDLDWYRGGSAAAASIREGISRLKDDGEEKQ